MIYPKQVMSINALRKLGITEHFLKTAYESKDQTFAWQSDPTKINSAILFDTDGLEKYRLKQIEAEKKARQQYRGVV